MATSDKPSDMVGGLTNRLIMVNGLIMGEREKKKRKKRIELPMLEYFMQMLSKRREDTWKLLGGSCIFCIFYLNTVLVYWLVYILYISSPHQSTTSHPPSLLLVHFILNSHKSTSVLPSWVEISTNVLSSEKFEALELLVEG